MAEGSRAEASSSARRGFGVTLVVGLAAAGLDAVAGNQAWASASGSGQADDALLNAIGDASAPPVTAFALVSLAVWGVILVTRGRFRRAIAWFGVVAAVLVLVACLAAFAAAPDVVRDALTDRGVGELDVHRSAWAYLAVLGSVVLLGATFMAARRVGTWPEMGRRYDAPGESGSDEADATPPEEQTNIDLWKAMDDGRDPTEGSGPDPLDSER